jgi:FAD/FMN-containing dehydrogenase
LLPVFHRECEYAIPADDAAEALQRFKRVVQECDISTILPVEVRFVARDSSLLSPARGRDVCYIGVAAQPNANEVYARFEPIMKDFGGRPHWGKHFSLTREEVEAMYPDSYDKFREIRQQLDPRGVFGNTLLRDLFDF